MSDGTTNCAKQSANEPCYASWLTCKYSSGWSVHVMVASNMDVTAADRLALGTNQSPMHCSTPGSLFIARY